MYWFVICFLFSKWGNRYFVNDDFSYLDFIQSIEGHIEDGLWTIELLKVLKDYAFRCDLDGISELDVYTVL